MNLNNFNRKKPQGMCVIFIESQIWLEKDRRDHCYFLYIKNQNGIILGWNKY